MSETQALVLGLGLQGRAVVYDLARSLGSDAVVGVDRDPARLSSALPQPIGANVRFVRADATEAGALDELLREHRPRVVVCMLPPAVALSVARIVVEGGAHYVSSSYTGRLNELHEVAASREVTILPEMGMDPGIDLLLCREAIDELDEVESLESYGGGLPESSCSRQSPLRYKLTWTFEGVLAAYQRPARFLRDGELIELSGDEIFLPAQVRSERFDELGPLEAYPNGDAAGYIERFGLGPELRQMIRAALRWPGHCEVWRTFVDLGLLSERETVSLPQCERPIAPRQLLAAHLGPQLEFGDEERDMVVIRVRARGRLRGRSREVRLDVVDFRDLTTGFFAMNRTVGFTTSVAAQLVLDGTISKRGLLSPARDVAPAPVLRALEERGIQVKRAITEGPES